MAPEQPAEAPPGAEAPPEPPAAPTAEQEAPEPPPAAEAAQPAPEQPTESAEMAEPTAPAQPAQPAQQVVRAVSLSRSGDMGTLRVSGQFDPARFEEVLLDPVDSALTLALEIPASRAAPDLPESQTFPDNPWISKIETSSVQFPDDPTLGLVTMVLELKRGATARLDPAGSGANGLSIVLEGAGTVRTAPPPPPAAQMAPTPPPGAEARPTAQAKPAAATPADTARMLPAMGESDPRLRLAPWKSRPTLVRIAVLNASGVSGQASRVAVMLMEVRRVHLEQTLGMKVEVANISNAPTFDRMRTVLYYRPGYLRAALQIAKLLPGEQTVEPMSADMLSREGLDVSLWLGKDLS